MCLGNITTYRCCGRKRIEYTGAGHCDLEQPDPKTHIVHGWKFVAEICSECTAREREEAANDGHREFEMMRRAKGVLEYFAGFRFHPRIRDESDWFVPRREERQVDSHSLTPLSFSKFVETTRGTIGIGAFPGKEERILRQDVGDYIEYLKSISSPPQHLHQFKQLFYSIRASEQENFDFNPKVISIPTFRKYIQVFGEQSLVGDEARDASWRRKTKAYESFLANFVAPERMKIDWQVARDKLAINDRRELYGFSRQDHLDLGGDVGWFEIQYEPTILSFHEFMQKNTEIWTFEKYVEEEADVLLSSDVERYESSYLYRFGTVEQITQWHNLRKSAAQHIFDFTPGPDTPNLLSFANFYRREVLARDDAQLTDRSLVPEYSRYIRSASDQVQDAFVFAWQDHIQRTRNFLYGWEGEGFPPLVTDLRDKQKSVIDLMLETMKHPWPAREIVRCMGLISQKLVPVESILLQRIALWLPLTVDESAEIQTRMNQCIELIAEASHRSQPDNDASLVDEDEDEEEEEDGDENGDEDEEEEQTEAEEDIPEVSRNSLYYEVPVSPCSDYNPSNDRLDSLNLPVSGEMDDETQEEIFVRFLDEDEDSDDEDRPWKRTRRNPPQRWFGEAEPLVNVHRSFR